MSIIVECRDLIELIERIHRAEGRESRIKKTERSNAEEKEIAKNKTETWEMKSFKENIAYSELPEN